MPGEVMRGETHKPLAWDPMPIGPLIQVTPAIAQTLMVEDREEAKEQQEQQEQPSQPQPQPQQ